METNDIIKINELYKSGKSVHQIAIIMNVCRKTVKKYLTCFDKSRSYHQSRVAPIQWATIEDRNRHVRELSKQYNAPTISRILHIGKRTVYRILGGDVIHHRPIYYTIAGDREKEIAALYGTIPTSEISKRFGIDCAQITRIAKRHGRAISDRRDSVRLYHNTDAYDFMAKLDSPEKLHLFGLFVADGNIYRNTSSITLKEPDRPLLDNVASFFNMGAIKIIGHRSFGALRYRAYYYITRVRVKEDLIKHGMLAIKADDPSPFDKFNDEEFRHVMLGFFDGDGVLCRKRYRCGFVGTRKVMEYIRDRFRRLIGIELRFYPHKNIFRIHTSDKRSIVIMLKWLYANPPTFCLARKMELASYWIGKLSASLATGVVMASGGLGVKENIIPSWGSGLSSGRVSSGTV